MEALGRRHQTTARAPLYLLFLWVSAGLLVHAELAKAGNQSAQEYGDAAYRYLNLSVPLWGELNYNHTAVFAGLRQSDGGLRSMESVNPNVNTTRETSFAEITTNNGEYYGAYTLSNLTLSFAGRKAIVSTASQLVAAAIPYEWNDALDWAGLSFDGTISDINNIRCDGFVEYAYEKNGIQIWRNTTDPISEWSIVSFPANHNDAPELTVDPHRELSPWAQRGAPVVGGPPFSDPNPNNTYMTTPAVVSLPTYQITQVTGSNYADVTIRATDNSGIHRIGFWRPGGSGWEYSPRQPQHPTSDSYAYTVRVTTDGYLYYFAQDNGANYPGVSEAAWIVIPPTPPFGVDASDGTFADRVRITWIGVSNATGYEIWRSTSSGSNGSLIGSTAATTFEDLTAQPGVTYYYRVRATNSAGTSGFSGFSSGFRAVPVCGNGSLETGETCDDGNTVSGDCCSGTCQLEPIGTVCRIAAGVCDVMETCNGSSASCPANVLAPSTSVCRAAAGECDVSETCDGSSASCPADVLAPSTSVCRAAAGECDVSETCDGVTLSCPTDGFVPAGLVNPSAVAVGFYDTCALDDAGVTCVGDLGSRLLAVPGGLVNPSAVAVGGTHTCALDDNGVTCWSSDGGVNSTPQSTVPAGLVNPRAIASGAAADHTCALDDNGVTCWGLEYFGELTVPAGLVNPSAVAVEHGKTCVIDENGLTCWGRNDYGELTVPAGLVNPSAVAVGFSHTCALDDNGVTCWGALSTVPAGLVNPSAIAVGWQHTCALDDNGITCWGGNNMGQSTVPNLFNPSAITAGAEQTCAIDDNGVTCWGKNQSFDEVIFPGTACTDDGLVCTKDLCDGAGSCMSAAGNAGTECRESAGECDVAEICDGIITSCPADGFVATGESCGDISGQCILADACDGVGICTDSGFVEDGTACDDGNVITVNDRCQAGICEGALPTIPTASFSGRTALVLWLLVSGMIVVGYRSRER